MIERSFIAVAAVMVPLTAALAEERRQMGVHEHGHGALNMALDGQSLEIELRVPGADIVGFEHEARSDADKTALDKAKAALAQPIALFGIPKSAGCELENSFVHYTKDPEHAAHHEAHHDRHAEDAGHAGDHHESAHHTDGDHEDHHAGHGSEHAEFHAGYEWKCAAPDRLTTLAFPYFQRFEGAKELEVNIVTEKGQSQYEVTRDNPTLDLEALM
jgi:Protein of unknown function (DUF2796)